MIAVLNFCSHDREQALKLLRWIGRLGGVRGHELVLQTCQQVAREGQHTELLEEAKKHFGAVELFVPYTEDERGWPQSPNHGWLEAVIHMRELYAKRPQGSVLAAWLWMEPDCVPLVSDWLDRLEAGYKSADKPFFGAEVTQPKRRLSGVAMYPAMVVSFLRHRKLSDLSERSQRGEAFDAYFAPEWLQFSGFTNLIQNVALQSRNPDVSPTFKDSESLSLIDLEAVLFHRCKDGTLIDRLEERLPVKKDEAAELTIGTRIAVLESLQSNKGAFDDAGRKMIEDMEGEIKRLKALSPVLEIEPVMDEEKELLRAKVKELERKLSVTVTDTGKNGFGKKKKRVRTLEQIASDKERMARARAGRKPKEETV